MTESNDETPEQRSISIYRRLVRTPPGDRLFVIIMTLCTLILAYGALAVLDYAATQIDVIHVASDSGANRISIVISLVGAVAFCVIFTILTAVGWAERETIWKTRVFRPLWIKNLFFAMISAQTALAALDYLIHGLTLHWASVVLDPEVRLIAPTLYVCAAFASLSFAEALLLSRAWTRTSVARLFGLIVLAGGIVIGFLIGLGARGIL